MSGEDKKLNILLINKFFYLKGGSERNYFDLLNLLRSRGHKVIPFSMKSNRNRKSEYEKYFIEHVSTDKFSFKGLVKFFWNYDAIRQLDRILKIEKIDIAHLHNIAHQISPAIIYKLKKSKIPIVQTLHDYKLICPNYKLFSRGEVCERCKGGLYYNCYLNKCVKNSYAKSLLASMETYLHRSILKSYNKVDFFIAPSMFMKKKCVEFGVSEHKIKIIRHQLSGNCDYSNICNKDKYFLYYGRLSEEKGLGLLLDSYIKSKTNFKLKIIGDGPYKDKLEQIVKKNKLDSKIELIKHIDDKKILNAYIKNSVAVIVPSLWYEVVGFVVLESMQLGKTVLAANIGGIKELIRDNDNGMLFRAGDSSDLASKMLKIESSDLSLIETKALASNKDLNPDNFYKQMIGIYEKLL